jgi:hypothetical protein
MPRAEIFGRFWHRTKCRRISVALNFVPQSSAGHSRTWGPTTQTRHEQSPLLRNRGTHGAFCKMPSHLACSEHGATLPPARHPWSWRSTYQIDGFRIQFRNLYPNEGPASLRANPGDTSLAERESGVAAGCTTAQTGSRCGRLPTTPHSRS